MTILKLSEKDTENINQLDNLSFGTNLNLFFCNRKNTFNLLRNGFILGIKENNELVSNIQVLNNDKNWFIHILATCPKKQGQGLADKLLKRVIKLSEEKGIHQIIAIIDPNNNKSINLFEKNEFKKKELLKDYHGTGKDRILVEYLNVKFS